jgi:hypothetical protein
MLNICSRLGHRMLAWLRAKAAARPSTGQLPLVLLLIDAISWEKTAMTPSNRC